MIKKYFVLVICMVFLTSFVSAAEFDNVKTYDGEVGKYGKIEIRNSILGFEWWQLDTVAEIELKHNTDTCLFECEATKEIKMYEDGVLIQDVRFLDAMGRDVPLTDYEFYVSGKLYEMGTKVKAGTYNVTLKGRKALHQNIDWQIKTQGIWLVEYAFWLGVDPDGYWKFNEGSGQNATDSSGNGYNASNFNDTAYVTGLFGNATSTNGDDGLNLSVTTPFNVENGTFTISFWMNTSQVCAATSCPVFANSFPNALPQGIMALINPTTANPGTFGFTLGDSGQAISLVSAHNNSQYINDSQWKHIVLTRDSTGIKLWINATIVYQNDSLNSENNYTSGNVTNFGMWTSGGPAQHRFYTGLIDDMAIYVGTSATQSDVTQIYNNGVGFELDAVVGVTTTLDSPADNLETVNSSIVFNATFEVTSLNFTNATLYVWNSSGDLFGTNTSIITGNTTNSSIRSLSEILIASDYSWNFYACGINSSSDTFCEFATANRTFTRSAFTEDASSFVNSSFETEDEFFQINLTTTDEVISVTGSLIHNGTSYGATTEELGGGKYSLSRTIDLPLVSADSNTSFFWKFDITETTGTNTQNSTIMNQSINNTDFNLCNGALTTNSVNYTIYNETDRTSTTSSFDGTFEWYLGTGTVIENSSYNTSVEADEFKFCLEPNRTFIMDSLITLNNESYNSKTYSFNNEGFSNNITEKQLYLNDIGSTVILEIKDAGLQPIQGYFVDVQRFYPGTNTFESVEHKETDIFGQAVTRLIENDVKYNFIIKDDDNNIVKESQILSVACRATICVLPFVIEDTTNDTARLFNVSDFDWTFSFNNNTNIFTFSWNDITGDAATERLLVERKLFNGTTIVCNTSSVSTFGSLTCDVGSTQATYVAQVFRKVGTNERRIAVINVKVGQPFATYGLEGLMWSFVLLFTLIGVGAFNPTVAGFLYLAGFIMLGTIGIISFTSPIFWAQTVIVILFIWAVRT